MSLVAVMAIAGAAASSAIASSGAVASIASDGVGGGAGFTRMLSVRTWFNPRLIKVSR